MQKEIKSDDVYEMLDHLRRLDCHNDNSYDRIYEIKSIFHEMIQKLPKIETHVNFQNPSTKNLAKSSKKPWDVYFNNLYHREDSSRNEMI